MAELRSKAMEETAVDSSSYTKSDECNIQVEFVGISVGDEFSTIDEFLIKIQEEQFTTNVQLWNRDSRTLQGAKNDTLGLSPMLIQH